MCVLYFGRMYLHILINHPFILFDDIIRDFITYNLKCDICSIKPDLLHIPKQKKIFNTQLYCCRKKKCSKFVCFDCAKGDKLKNIPLHYSDIIIKH